MNKIAFDFLKDLQQQLTILSDEQKNKLKEIKDENFIDDVSENVFARIDDILYEIETVMIDVEAGYYNGEGNDFDDDFENNFEDF